MKKISAYLLAGCFLSLHTPLQAKTSDFSGATLSGSLGYVTGHVNNSLTVQPAAPGNPAVDSTKIGTTGVMGELALGYADLVTPCFYLGGEVFASLSSLKGQIERNSANYSGTTTLKSPFGFGIKVRPGWLLNPKTVLHLTLGVTWTRWKASAPQDNGIRAFRAASLSKLACGFSYGFGCMIKVSKELTLGLEFVRTQYKAMNLSQASANFRGQAMKQTFKPSTNVIALRMTYQF